MCATEAMTPFGRTRAPRLADNVADVAARRRHQCHRAQRRTGARRRRRARRARQAGHRHRDPLDHQPGHRAELADELRPQGIHIVDAPVSGGAGAAEKGELAVMVGADREAYERDQAGVQAVGVDGRPRRRARRGNPDEAGAQHVDVHRLRRGVRGDEAGRGRGIDLQQLGRVVRHTDALTRRTGRDHGPRGHETACARPLAARHVHPHPRARREGSEPGAGAGRGRRASTCRWPKWRCRTWPPASVCRTQSTTKE